MIFEALQLQHFCRPRLQTQGTKTHGWDSLESSHNLTKPSQAVKNHVAKSLHNVETQKEFRDDMFGI